MTHSLQQNRAVAEQALLRFPDGPDFVPGLLGCLHAGMIALPALAGRHSGSSLRKDLLGAEAAIGLHGVAATPASNYIVTILHSMIVELAQKVGTAPERFDVHALLKRFGMTSLKAVKFYGMLREHPGKEVPATALYEVQTTEELARIVFGDQAHPNTLERAQERPLNVDSLGEGGVNRLLRDGDRDSYPVDRGEHLSNV